MRAKPGIKRYSLEQLKHLKDRTVADPPIGPDPPEAWWKTARLVFPASGRKAVTTLRIDRDVLDWFRSQGRGHQTRMNAVLRAYYEVQKSAAGPQRRKAHR